MLQTLWHGLTDLIYPPHCPVCAKHFTGFPPTDRVCPGCTQSVVLNRPPFCPKCSRHLKKYCLARCRECCVHKPHFDFAWSACLYEDPLKALIIQFKYYQKTYYRQFFAYLMKNFLEIYRLDIMQFDIIVPIPLHPSRLRERGYNQAQLLAQPIADFYNISLLSKFFLRARPTEHQTSLGEKERWTNIHRAFRITDSRRFKNKNILIIDDLLTTGATASEAARTLKSAGAKTVGVLTLAITA